MDKLSESYLQMFELALAKTAALLYATDMPVHSAVKYALAAGGKRVRPLICMQAAVAAGKPPESSLPAAIAVEMIHTYSLIHDDLPCMDNDDLRRGKPTVHKAFAEDTALLAGDALLTDAFLVLTSPDLATALNAGVARPEVMARQVQLLASAAGGSGMVYGQALDLFWTARSGASKNDLNAIHLNKTGKLLGAAAALGAAAGEASDATIDKFKEFGQLAGLAFQIKDDLLDTQSGTWKSVGKDAEAGKLTYATTTSRADSEQAAEHFTNLALSSLEATGLNVSALGATAQALLSRTK